MPSASAAPTAHLSTTGAGRCGGAGWHGTGRWRKGASRGRFPSRCRRRRRPQAARQESAGRGAGCGPSSGDKSRWVTARARAGCPAGCRVYAAGGGRVPGAAPGRGTGRPPRYLTCAQRPAPPPTPDPPPDPPTLARASRAVSPPGGAIGPGHRPRNAAMIQHPKAGMIPPALALRLRARRPDRRGSGACGGRASWGRRGCDDSRGRRRLSSGQRPFDGPKPPGQGSSRGLAGRSHVHAART